jgi:hypothetical protein
VEPNPDLTLMPVQFVVVDGHPSVLSATLLQFNDLF